MPLLSILNRPDLNLHRVVGIDITSKNVVAGRLLTLPVIFGGLKKYERKKMEHKILGLENIFDFTTQAKIEEGLKSIAENISDPNTPATKKRKLAINIDFEPAKTRDYISLKVSVKKVLADFEETSGNAYLAEYHGKKILINNNPEQFEIEYDNDNVQDLNKKQGAI